jgi:hypothetical protein
MLDRIMHAVGWEGSTDGAPLLPAPIFKKALRAALGHELLPLGFEQAKDLKWVRSAKGPIREIVELYSLKGASVAPCWGLSLDFVPHVAGGRVRWHRTAKSSMLDLVWDPLDFAGLTGWTLSRFTAAAELPQVTKAFAGKVCRAALADLARAAQVSDLPTLYREWAARPCVRFSALNYHQATLGEAFVLAKLGLPGAIEVLREGAARFSFDDATMQELLKRLETSSAPT